MTASKSHSLQWNHQCNHEKIVGSQIMLSTILAIQNNNHIQEHKYLRGKLFLFEEKKLRDKL